MMAIDGMYETDETDEANEKDNRDRTNGTGSRVWDLSLPDQTWEPPERLQKESKSLHRYHRCDTDQRDP